LGNSILNKAKYSNNTDEWFTDYKTVEDELIHYESQFAEKIVLCNCDDPIESAFSKYFLKNFNKLKLKKLICTSYIDSRIHDFRGIRELSGVNCETTYVMIVAQEVMKNKHIESDEDIIRLLKEEDVLFELDGDGDFRSDECVEYLKIADIVVTNPPFSLFRELFSLLVEYKKKYLLISNQNAITYKEIFPYIKRNEAKVGYHFGEMAFRVPDDTPPRKTRFWIDDDGQKWRSIGNAMWLTNLEVKRVNGKLNLEKSFDENEYQKYDNFDAIHIKRVVEIPYDYYGIMGVPITFLQYHDENQFEIIGEANHGSDNEYDLFKPIVNGKEVFKRILIRRVRKEK